MQVNESEGAAARREARRQTWTGHVFLDLLGALSDAEVRFLIVGGYAVGVHGHPRATKDLDVWVKASPENASRLMAALRAFVAPIGGLTEATLAPALYTQP